MNRRKFLALCGVGSVSGVTGCVSPVRPPQHRQATNRNSRLDEDSLRPLWRETIGEYLQDTLWDPINRYDAGHVTMVPLHVAFETGVREWKSQFRTHVRDFVDEGLPEYNSSTLRSESQLGMVQYLYVMSRYLVLEAHEDDDVTVPQRLSRRLTGIIEYLWEEFPAWQWGHEDFTGIRNRIGWKLSQDYTDPRFYRAIVDSELFVFAIAADLYTYHSTRSHTGFPKELLNEILEYAELVYKRYGQSQPDGGWLFQPGVWADHRDYKYACYEEKRPNLEPCIVEGIAQDSSHSFRHSLWLRSLANAASKRNRTSADFYDWIQEGFATQFMGNVVVPPTESFSTYRTTNYMDGRNGLYRWEYETAGEDDGYGPFELSGSLTFGWWSFFDDPRIARMYSQIASQFPLSEDVIDVYVGPNTTRERNPLVALPQSYHNGLRKAMVSLAAAIDL